MHTDPYQQLARQLDALPNGFPSTPDGAELRLLACIFTPEQAALAAHLAPELEPLTAIAARLESAGEPIDQKELGASLKQMARLGLIEAGRTADGIGYKLMPFVVGIYEAQISRIDKDIAQAFEAYYRQAFGQMLQIEPTYHRVIPVGESVRVDMEVHPFESASEIVNAAQSWGVMPCICRTQKALIGEPCSHPIETCMVLGPFPDMFDHSTLIQPLDRQGAHVALQRAASAGLVHTVSNNQQGTTYICNCCTCSCGILRGMAELGIANAVARSAFVNQVDESRCVVCESCLTYCQFEALILADGHMQVNQMRCVGCGVCVSACPEGALVLVRRPEAEVLPVPVDQAEWRTQRAASRSL